MAQKVETRAAPGDYLYPFVYDAMLAQPHQSACYACSSLIPIPPPCLHTVLCLLLECRFISGFGTVKPSSTARSCCKIPAANTRHRSHASAYMSEEPYWDT